MHEVGPNMSTLSGSTRCASIRAPERRPSNRDRVDEALPAESAGSVKKGVMPND